MRIWLTLGRLGQKKRLTTLKSGMEAGSIAVQSHGALPVVDQLIENLDSLLNLTEPEQEPTAQPDQQQQPWWRQPSNNNDNSSGGFNQR